MIIIVAAIAGAILGGLKAKKRGGKPADIAQYAAGYGIAFSLVAVMVTIAIERLVL